MPNLHDVLIHILDLTYFNGDREEMVAILTRLINSQAIEDLINSAEISKQKEIIAVLKSTPNDATAQAAIIQRYFSAEAIAQAYKNASSDIFNDMLRELIPKLTSQEQRSLQEYISSSVV